MGWVGGSGIEEAKGCNEDAVVEYPEVPPFIPRMLLPRVLPDCSLAHELFKSMCRPPRAPADREGVNVFSWTFPRVSCERGVD